MSASARIFNIQHFSIHDGPGIRTTVFMKGCNLRCHWCHNPESWTGNPVLMRYPDKCIGCGECVRNCPNAVDGKLGIDTGNCAVCGSCVKVCYAGALELTGKTANLDEVLQEILADAGLYKSSGGGVTFSGGEPFLQPDFLADILPVLKEYGIHTAVESALYVNSSILETLLPGLDLIMCDIKHMNSGLHMEYTGADNSVILENIRSIAEHGQQMIIRTPVVPGFNDSEQSIGEIATFIASLPNQENISYELLRFSGICRDKYSALGMNFPCEGLSAPSKERMRELLNHAGSFGLKVLSL